MQNILKLKIVFLDSSGLGGTLYFSYPLALGPPLSFRGGVKDPFFSDYLMSNEFQVFAHMRE